MWPRKLCVTVKFHFRFTRKNKLLGLFTSPVCKDEVKPETKNLGIWYTNVTSVDLYCKDDTAVPKSEIKETINLYFYVDTGVFVK